MLVLSAEIFDKLRGRWVDQLGPDRMRALETDLATVARPSQVVTDLPGWLG